MGCFSCFYPSKKKEICSGRIEESNVDGSGTRFNAKLDLDGRKKGCVRNEKNYCALSFHFRELAVATKNFRDTNLIGEGGFGKVYKGVLDSGLVVAIKQLNRNGVQGSKEFLVEVLMLSMLHHPNLVTLHGYCAEGDERLLVYEYMPKGSLEDHLFDLPPGKPSLDWNTRIKVALGAAKGLTYLHDVANPPVIYRDMKAANILLDEDFNPKLSDFGLAKVGPVGGKTHVSTRVMGTYGYCAPDYAMSGKLTLKSDVYSFGVLLLELISGRRAYDCTKDRSEQNLLVWARPYLNDRRQFNKLADPLLQGRFPTRGFYQLVVITSMCLQEQPQVRPIIADVVVAITHIAAQPFIPEVEATSCPPLSPSPSPSPSPHGCKARKVRKKTCI